MSLKTTFEAAESYFLKGEMKKAERAINHILKGILMEDFSSCKFLSS